MKKFFFYILLLPMLFDLSCTRTDDNDDCGDRITRTWDNNPAAFIEIVPGSGQALFRLIVEETDMCIFQMVDFRVELAENTPSYISKVQCFVSVPNSTDYGISVNKEGKSWQVLGDVVDLGQGFKVNPGSMRVILDIFVPATSQAEAQQKYDASVDMINSYIKMSYNRPKL